MRVYLHIYICVCVFLHSTGTYNLQGITKDRFGAFIRIKRNNYLYIHIYIYLFIYLLTDNYYMFIYVYPFIHNIHVHMVPHLLGRG